MSNESTLTSLAMLKVNIDHGKDYLEYLRPFILDILTNDKPVLLTDEAISIKLRERFGLEIPRRTSQILLQRLRADRILTKAEGFFRITGDIPETSIAVDKAVADRHIRGVISGFLDFAKSQSGKELTEDQAVEALLSFLSKFSIPCLKAYLRGTTIPLFANGQDWKIVLASQYIYGIHQKCPDKFESFMAIVQGHMLANALLCPDLKEASKYYHKVIFYLDTPLLLQRLGLEGEPRKQAIEEVIALVRQLGGKVACFEHSFNELISLIKGASDFIDSAEGKGAIVFEARRNKLSRSDLLLIAGNAEDSLSKAEISVEPTPPYINDFQIDQKAFEKVLEDEVHHHNPKARDYDIDSVRSIYVLRKGMTPFSVEKCKAVLVTGNDRFSKAACDYGKNHESSREVSSVITDFSLANTAWLKAPQGAPGLPRKEVLAFAYAAMKPTKAYWEKVLKETEKLEKSGQITPKNHQLLRSSVLAQDELMKLTLGEEIALTSQTINETLRRVTDEIKAEESAKLSAEQAAHAETSKRLQEMEGERENTKKTIYWRCEKKAKEEALFLTVVVGILFILSAVIGVIKIPESPYWGGICILLGFGGIGIQILSYFIETNLFNIYQKIKKWRLETNLRKEYKAFGFEE